LDCAAEDNSPNTFADERVLWRWFAKNCKLAASWMDGDKTLRPSGHVDDPATPYEVDVDAPCPEAANDVEEGCELYEADGGWKSNWPDVVPPKDVDLPSPLEEVGGANGSKLNDTDG
jgi:hypothetical protein